MYDEAVRAVLRPVAFIANRPATRPAQASAAGLHLLGRLLRVRRSGRHLGFFAQDPAPHRHPLRPACPRLPVRARSRSRNHSMVLNLAVRWFAVFLIISISLASQGRDFFWDESGRKACGSWSGRKLGHRRYRNFQEPLRPTRASVPRPNSARSAATARAMLAGNRPDRIPKRPAMNRNRVPIGGSDRSLIT